MRRSGRSVWLSLAGSVVGLALSLLLAAGPAVAVSPRWLGWDFGALYLTVPERWRPLGALQPLDPAAGDWEAVFAEQPDAVERGAFLRLSWAEEPYAYADSLEAGIAGRRPATIGELAATRTDFALRDAYNDTRGFDVVTDRPAARRHLVVTCRMPWKAWRRGSQDCEALLASIDVRIDEPEAVAAGPEAADGTSDPSSGFDATAEADAVGPTVAETDDAAVEPPPETGAPDDELLFAGTLDPGWQAYATAGGDFAAFASVGSDGLTVGVPAGHGWAKTGIASLATLVTAAEGNGWRFDVAIDPVRTTSFVLNFATRIDVDEWSADGFRLAWSRAADGATGRLTVWIDRNEVAATTLGPEAPATLSVVFRPDGTVVTSLPNGEHLDVVLPPALRTVGLHLIALAHAPGEGEAAALALTSIRRLALEPPTVADGLLFDGALGSRFVVSGAQGGRFADHGRLTAAGLAVDVPAGSGWGKVGLVSPDPVLWLDDFRPGASADLVYAFDPDRTSGLFVVIAAAGTSRPGEATDPEPPALRFHWRDKPDGSGAKASAGWAGSDQALFDVDLPAEAPAEVRFSLRPGELTISFGSYVSPPLPWPDLAEGQGLRTWVLSHAAEADAPVRMLLRSIRLERTAAAPADIAPPGPAPGVEPLPVRTLFSGRPGPDWEPVGVAGGDFDQFAHWTDGGLVVDVPEGHSWGKTGLLSVEPVAVLDQRFGSTAYRLTIRVDPKTTTGFVAALSTERQADMWLTNRLWTTLARLPDGRYNFALDWGGARTWVRPVDGDFVERRWTGDLIIDLGAGWSTVRLGSDGPVIRAPYGFAAGSRLYAEVQSHATAEGRPVRLGFLGLAGGWVTPPGLTADRRWFFVDAPDFDPDRYLEELAADLP